MKINIETKYNAGDVLYCAGYHNNILKRTITMVSVKYNNEDNKLRVFYNFLEDGDCAWEDYMKNYATTPQGAAEIIAKRALDNFSELEDKQ